MKTKCAMYPCTSSQIKEFGYHQESKTLAVRFHSKKGPGSVYEYQNVPPDLYEEFQAAESKGKFFGERLKGHADRYPFTRINEDEEEQKATS